LKSIEKQIEELEGQMQLLAEEHCQDLFPYCKPYRVSVRNQPWSLSLSPVGSRTLLRPNSLVPLLGFALALMNPAHPSGDIEGLAE
jgi:hypothetical protein